MKNACTLVLALCLSSSVFAQRTWTSRDGRTVKARLIKQEVGTVTLENLSGRQVTFPLSSLSPTDQRWLKQRSSLPYLLKRAIEVNQAHREMSTAVVREKHPDRRKVLQEKAATLRAEALSPCGIYTSLSP